MLSLPEFWTSHFKMHLQPGKALWDQKLRQIPSSTFANHDQGHQGQVVAVTLITAKARVTPTKTESVSRLELAACMIGIRLGLTVANTMDIDKSTITFWTDSTNCLYWIKSPSSELKTFVANRVGEVHTHSKPSQWRHIPTDLNPADIPTRLPKI